ncbi:hypothetical protein SuNHUV7_29490 (plasmid) [Pseudoseohaeicola sp. NH-UV-7]
MKKTGSDVLLLENAGQLSKAGVPCQGITLRISTGVTGRGAFLICK